MERVRHDLRLAELEVEAFALAFGSEVDPGLAPVRVGAEAGAHERFTFHAFLGQAGIELIGTPGHGHVLAAREGEGLRQSALADPAPGADGVGEDFDVHWRLA